MQIVIVAPCLLPQTIRETCPTPPQLAMHLAASTPVRHRVKIVDMANDTRFCTDGADLYVLLWPYEFSPILIEIAMQFAPCDRFLCVWDGPTPAPVDYLLEFCDHVLFTTQSAQWQQLLTAIETEQHQLP